MAFNTQEQEIIKYGIANGKTKQQVSEAISNYRLGIIPTPTAPSTSTETPKPTEPSLVSKLGSTAQDFVSGVKDISGRVASSETNPVSGNIQLMGNVAEAGLKGVGNVLTSTPVVGEGIKAVSQPVGEGIKAFQGWLENNPTFQKVVTSDTAQKVASVLDAHPDIARNAEAVNNIVNAVLVAKGGVETAGKLSTVTKDVASGIDNVASNLPKVTIPTGITPDAESIMQRVARVSKGKQASFEQKAGESIGSFLDKRGIYGNIDQISEQLYKRFNESKNNADTALATLQGNYQPEVVKTSLDKLQGYLKDVSSPGAVDPQLKEVTGLINKFDKQGLTMSEINQVKRLYERNVKLDFLKSNNPKGVTEANNIDNAIREWQFSQAEKLGLKNLPDINKETMLSKELLNSIGKEYSGSAGNNAVTLTDWIMLSNGDPTAVAGFLVKKGFSSKAAQSWVAKNISKNTEKVPVPQGEFTTPKVMPIGTYKDFLKATTKN